MGEEWRKEWHPERIRPKESEKPVLVVGAGPAGLEAAHALGKRGYEVALAEKSTEYGGRVSRESRLPGLAAWARVRDYRVQQLSKLPNVETYFDSGLDASDILELGYPRVVLSTGAEWRRDGVGRYWLSPMPVEEGVLAYTPDDIMDGVLPEGERVLVWDDDHYYMGGVVAELMARQGKKPVLATPGVEVSTWTRSTMEQHFIQERLIDLGVEIRCCRNLESLEAGSAELSCIYSGRNERLAADAVILVTSRSPVASPIAELLSRKEQWSAAGIEDIAVVGDALAPATIAHAVYAGRRYAEELDGPSAAGDFVPFRREIAELSAG